MTSAKDDFHFFRIRMNFRQEKERAKCAWNMGQVGIWFGAWTPDELNKADILCKDEGKDAAAKYMEAREEEKTCKWEFKKSYFETCIRFRDIEEHKDWVVVFFDETLCIGQLDGNIQTKVKHEFNFKPEIFHFRSVINQITRPLEESPAYKLIKNTGQQTVHRHIEHHQDLKNIILSH